MSQEVSETYCKEQDVIGERFVKLICLCECQHQSDLTYQDGLIEQLESLQTFVGEWLVHQQIAEGNHGHLQHCEELKGRLIHGCDRVHEDQPSENEEESVENGPSGVCSQILNWRLILLLEFLLVPTFEFKEVEQNYEERQRYGESKQDVETKIVEEIESTAPKRGILAQLEPLYVQNQSNQNFQVTFYEKSEIALPVKLFSEAVNLLAYVIGSLFKTLTSTSHHTKQENGKEGKIHSSHGCDEVV